MPMKPMHRLVHQAERPGDGVEWACPQCGHYQVTYPYIQVVVLQQGAANVVHMPGPEFPSDPDELPSLSESDQDFLRSHAMAWEASGSHEHNRSPDRSDPAATKRNHAIDTVGEKGSETTP
jgi:hypothetical protein